MAGRMSFQKKFFFPEVQNGTRGAAQENLPPTGIHSLTFCLTQQIQLKVHLLALFRAFSMIRHSGGNKLMPIMPPELVEVDL